MDSSQPAESTNSNPRVLVFARVRLFCEGLASYLAQSSGLEVVGAVSSLEGALAQIVERRPEFVVLDATTPSSLQVADELRRADPSVRVIAFAIDEDGGQILACAQARISAFVSTDATIGDLVRVIHGLSSGELVCTSRTSAILYSQLQRLTTRADTLGLGILTAREREVLVLVDRDMSNKEIARALNIQVATVKNHIHRILEKLGVSSRFEAASRLHASISDGLESETLDPMLVDRIHM